MNQKGWEIVFVIGIVLFCLMQSVTAQRTENILGIGNLSGELLDWGISVDVWHGNIGINLTVELENTGDSETTIQWRTENSEGARTIPANWRGEVIFDAVLNPFTQKFYVQIYGIDSTRNKNKPSP